MHHSQMTNNKDADHAAVTWAVDNGIMCPAFKARFSYVFIFCLQFDAGQFVLSGTMQTRNDFSLWICSMCMTHVIHAHTFELVSLEMISAGLLHPNRWLWLTAHTCDDIFRYNIGQCDGRLLSRRRLLAFRLHRSSNMAIPNKINISIFTLAYCQFKKFAFHIFHQLPYVGAGQLPQECPSIPFTTAFWSLLRSSATSSFEMVHRWKMSSPSLRNVPLNINHLLDARPCSKF